MNGHRRHNDGSQGYRRHSVLILISALWLVSATNCGYRFAGGGSFPGAVQSLFVDVLVNHSAETGIESILTNTF